MTWILIGMCLLYPGKTEGQCKLDTGFFSVDERLDFNLHYNWKFVWIKAGEAALISQSGTCKGIGVYKTQLTARSTGVAKKLMSIGDTLTGQVSNSDFSPLFYVKAAHEGKTHSYEEIDYEYPGKDRVKAQLKHWRNGKFRGDTLLSSKKCFYDPVSLIYFMRSLNPSGMTVNQSVSVPILFTDESFDVKVTYRGTEIIEVNDEKINTVKYSFSINGKAFENKKESLFLWLSNDGNRIPVQIETKLKIGSLKAQLKKATGCKNPYSAFPTSSKIVGK
ncbi:MAG: DUF3108 domain-containing protein [Candidatus Azobacteroides sp.]|nr:DUF3108 domain-containing protein [Candidatus Azobacteroides sp.]